MKKIATANKGDNELMEAAVKAASGAYTISGFRVGAAVRANGVVFVGANVENSSLGLSICAERVALANAVVSGNRNIESIAVACIDVGKDAKLSDRMPCGACRQWLAELAPNANVYIMGNDIPFKVDALIPHAFRFDKINRAKKKSKAVSRSTSQRTAAGCLLKD